MVSYSSATGSTDADAQYSEDEANGLVDLETGGAYKTLVEYQAAASLQFVDFSSQVIMGGATDISHDCCAKLMDGCVAALL